MPNGLQQFIKMVKLKMQTHTRCLGGLTEAPERGELVATEALHRLLFFFLLNDHHM